MEAALPFAIEGFDCDNGSRVPQLASGALLPRAAQESRLHPLRPYHKNDNGHVEQKNWTHVRQLLGYERLEDPEMVNAINTLYRELWEPLHNYFCASAKLVSKDRHGAKVKRRHDRPMTPCDRLLQPATPSALRRRLDLRAMRKALNPFELQPTAGGRPAPVAAAGSSFQSPSGLLALRARSSNTAHLTLGVITSEATIPSSTNLAGVIYF